MRSGRRRSSVRDRLAVPIMRVFLRDAFESHARKLLVFGLPEPTEITLSIHDLAGCRIAAIIRGRRKRHTVPCGRCDEQAAFGGMYFTRLECSTGAIARSRIVVIR
jgi:hypothetical protein